MKNGYDQFFKQARKAAAGPSQPRAQKSASPRFEMKNSQLETNLKRKMGVKPPKKSSGFSWKLSILSVMGFVGALWGMQNAEQVEKYVKRIEIGWMGEAHAEEKKPETKSAAKADEAKETETKAVSSPEEVDHLSKLIDRKKELDAREEELQRQEAELAKMKTELERRIAELGEMREKISEVLRDKVKSDEQRVDTLVQMYSNMKPPQAAKIFEALDEDLVVEILSKMKKKNAADIMNLLKPEKAQVFSEKYAGYKRK